MVTGDRKLSRSESGKARSSKEHALEHGNTCVNLLEIFTSYENSSGKTFYCKR